MGKIIRRDWSEEQMDRALQRLIDGEHRLCVPPQPDDDDLVIAGTIEEVLALRSKVDKLEESRDHHRWCAECAQSGCESCFDCKRLDEEIAALTAASAPSAE